MKNLSKILCAVLVLAMLCSSLIFMIGAEEEEATPAYTSVEATFAEMLKLNYNAEDNLIISITRPTNTANGWNGEGARQAHIVTNNLTGESWYREWFEGDAFLLKDGGEPANVGGNEYIQFNFTKQTLTYEEGYHEYIVVDMDLAYKAKTATIWDKTQYVSTSYMKQEVIGRSTAGTSWATVQNYKDFGLGDGFKHVTTVYDYTGGNAYVFVNGTLAVTYTNGALTAAVKSAYLSGTNVTVEEWRIGSNSADEMHIANPYVRYTKMANAEDTLATAISSGKISTWGGNIYDNDYVVPTPYWFVKSADHTEVADYISKINTTTAVVLDTSVAGNLYVGSGQSTSIGNGVDVFGAKQTVADDLTYVTFYGAKSGSTNNKNTFWQFNTLNAPNVSITAGSTAYYVVDFDIATHGNALPYIDVSVMLRRASDGAGFPFSPNVDVAPYINSNGEWNHVTIVGDIGANLCYVFVNGEYAETLEYAYKASEASGNTELSPKGIRVDIGLSAKSFDVVEGQNIALDNFSERVYTDATSSSGLDAAVAAGDLNNWANHTNGNAGRMLPVIATVNGVKYYNSNKLATALISNDKLDVEYFSEPFTPAVLQANATVKTNGFDMAKLFTLSPVCEIVSNEDGVIKTYAPFTENRVENDVHFPGGVNIPEVYNAIKYDVTGNLFTSFQPISLQKDGKYQHTWGTTGFRYGNLITNLDTGDVYYRDSVNLLPDGTMADGLVFDADGNVVGYKEADKGANDTFIKANEYINFKFSAVELKYEAGKNEYIVVDFDFGTDGELVDDLPVQVIPRVSGSGAWATDVHLRDLPIARGEMAHVTIVYDYTTNNAHVFIDGIFVYSVYEGAMDGDNSGGRTDGNKWADRYMKGEAFKIEEFKLSTDHKKSTVCFDNFAVRAYDLSASNDVIGAAVAAGDITTWADSIYNDKYVTSKIPAVATVDGVDYGTVDALNAALAVETGAVKNVYFKHSITETVVVKTEATVETNGLPVDFNYETGLYQFHHDNPYYVCTGTDYAYASNRLIMAHEDGSTVYSFENINQDNAAAHATPVVWFYSLDPEQVEVVFYVHGDQIKPLTEDAYIEDGKLYKDEWSYMDQDFVVGEVAESFPVASKALSETWYLHSAIETEADFAASDIKQSASVSSNVQFTVYVNASQTLTDGELTVVDGQEYLTYTFEFAPHDFDKNFTVEFLVEDEAGKQYVQKQNVSFVSYAEDLLKVADAETKALVVALLNYSNEANKLFEGEGVAKAEELIAANTPATGTPSEVYNTADLSTVIRSAAMKLNSTPEFLFKVARGFKGTLNFTYTGVNGTKTLTETVDATAMEQIVTLNNFIVADIFEDITITATYEDGTTVTGKYNLSTYANGLDNPAFANALLAYAQASKSYMENAPRPTFDADGNVIKYELLDKESVTNTALTTVVTNKIKQWDQSDAHNVHTGTPVWAKVARNDALVEALYFSKTTPWIGDEGEQFSEYRLAVNGEKAGPAVTKITFWYLASGTVDENKGSGNGGYTFKDLQGNFFVADAYVQIKTPSNHPLAGDNYPELSGTDFMMDSEWHYMEITFDEPIVIIDILFNLYHFQGEFLVSDLVITYVE